MAWTATLTSKTRDALGRIVVVVTLTNGTDTDTMTLTTDTAPTVGEWLARQVKSRVAQLDALDAWAASLPAPGAAVDLTVNTAPTAAEVAEAQWITDYRMLKRYNYAVTDGLIASNNPQRAALVTKVKDTFLPAYIVHLTG